MFLSQSVERAYHILAFAAENTWNSTRRLVYAATHESYLTDDPGAPGLHSPIFLDHQGDWQSRVDLRPSAPYRKTPVRLTRPVESPLGVCY